MGENSALSSCLPVFVLSKSLSPLSHWMWFRGHGPCYTVEETEARKPFPLDVPDHVGLPMGSSGSSLTHLLVSECCKGLFTTSTFSDLWMKPPVPSLPESWMWVSPCSFFKARKVFCETVKGCISSGCRGRLGGKIDRQLQGPEGILPVLLSIFFIC